MEADLTTATITIANDRDDYLACEAVLLARAYAWELLHKVFGGEPTGELLSLIGSDTTSDVLDELAQHNATLANLRDFAARVGEKSLDASFTEEVREEFARFFQGPAEPPAFPWAGPYLTHESTIFQPSTLAVRRAYAKAGLQVKRYQHVPDDHVSIMAAFMATLSRRALEALQAGNREAACALLKSQQAFVRDHLATWLPEYAELSLRVKKAVLYPQFIQGAKALAEVDEAFLSEALAWLEEMDDERLQAASSGENPFAETVMALDGLAALVLPGIEDNELVEI